MTEQNAEEYDVSYTKDGKKVSADAGTVTFTVTDKDADYQLVCNNDKQAPPVGEDKKAQPPAGAPGKAVKTGDTVTFFGALALLALSALVLLLTKRRRGSHN